MTEREWLAATNVGAMVQYLHRQASGRKLLQFACTCFQRFIQDSLDGRTLKVVDVLEGYAEGQISFDDVVRLKSIVMQAGGVTDILFSDGIGRTEPFWRDSFGQYHAAWQTALRMCEQATLRKPGRPSKGAGQAWRAKKLAIIALLRDIFGNPFRPITLDPSWLTATVTSLAEGIYAERAFDRLPILADALEEAGCTSTDVLNHCRQPGEHVRGCWVVDLLLGKT